MISGVWPICLQNLGPLLEEAVACASHPIFEIEKLMKNTDKLLIANRFKEDNEFRPWDILKLLARFLVLSHLELYKNACEYLGLPDMSDDLLKMIRVSADQCWTNIKILNEYEYEYIRVLSFHRIRI